MLPFRLIKTQYMYILVDKYHNIVYYNTLINQNHRSTYDRYKRNGIKYAYGT